MCSTFNASSRPAAWTVDQPNTSPEAELAVNSCEFQSFEFNATGFAAADFSSTCFQGVSESIVEKSGLPFLILRSLPTLEWFAISTELLVSPYLAVAVSEAVYDAEYQLGAATQVKCRIGYCRQGSERRSRDITFIQVNQPFTSSAQTVPVLGILELIAFLSQFTGGIVSTEELVEQAPITVTVCTNCSTQEAPVPEADAQPEPESEVTQIEDPAPAVEPVLEPVSESDYVDIDIDNTPDTSVSDEADPFYETLKTIS
ncbi:hypothetical protein Forpe1208_v013615 [Fusarium oxysporum f. sp. rapae]|uniref:Uncharacterized protein n=1 Tax=Fusarium oxysporum f. sp. rapae TaxID=485398 RepID=A0A8J5NSL4_FUSOX|nr:hypothetical protein Forpe1208_v013615 [Fusarium oxysporum f. sp. rapae]